MFMFERCSSWFENEMKIGTKGLFHCIFHTWKLKWRNYLQNTYCSNSEEKVNSWGTINIQTFSSAVSGKMEATCGTDFRTMVTVHCIKCPSPDLLCFQPRYSFNITDSGNLFTSSWVVPIRTVIFVGKVRIKFSCMPPFKIYVQVQDK